LGYIKSQKIPDDEFVNHVKIVVGHTFSSSVYDPNKHVLLLVYDPICPYSRAFLPQYETLAKMLQNNNNLLLCKIDGTSNTVPKEAIAQGYPSLFISPANRNELIQYPKKDRNLEDIIQFINENTQLSIPNQDIKLDL